MAAKKDAAVSMSDLLGAAAAADAPVEAPAEAAESAAPPHILATYAGQFFKSGSNGNELEPYRVTVKIPLHWLERDDLSPLGMFRAYIAKREKVLGGKPGFSGVMTAELVETSKLPGNISESAFLRWCASFSDLQAFATRKKLPIMFELYANTTELRHAINRAIEAPEAFFKEQEGRKSSKELTHRASELDLEALGL